MSENDITKKSSETDWAALEAMAEEEIDYSDIPQLSDAFFQRAGIWKPQKKVSVTFKLDEDVLKWFQAVGDDWELRIQAALRLYAETHKKAYR